MSKLSILQAFVSAGMTPVGACAMGGNIQAEGVWRGNNAQDAYEKARGFTDASYTAAVDNGSYTREQFCRDDVGYGLCQWTERSRKAKLYDFAKTKGTSISDEAMQAEFCIAELKTDYPALWRYLCETQDITAATDRICREYERPAVNNTSVRSMYANQLYMQYGTALESTMSQLNLDVIANARKNRTEPTDNRTRAIENAQCAMPTIKRGDKSAEAHYLRKLLDNLGYDTVWDGVWAALVDYQGKRGLTVDGICGAETWARLMKEGKE